MTEPIEYSNIGHMLANHAPYLIVGAISLIGATMIILRKAGVLIFEKEIKAKEKDCNHCGIDKKVVMGKDEEAFPFFQCPAHPGIEEAQAEFHTNQIEMLAQQKTNTTQLLNGKKQFEKMRSEITDLKVGVGVLLDRSGGRPKEFADL